MERSHMSTFTHDYIAGRFAGGHSIQVCGYTFAPVKPKATAPKYTLKPLITLQEIVAATLAGKTIMRRDDYCSEWGLVLHPRTGISIHELTTWYFAEQVPAPKTILINGVEVPAPVKDGGWFVSLHDNAVYPSKSEDKVFRSTRYYWATKEDAEAVLAAMLKPFKELEDAAA